MIQSQALEILKTGANVFLTGEPGAGKTYVINEYIAWLEATGLTVAVTASTGIAATHLGGMTIHSWSGLGIKNDLTRGELETITGREKLMKRIKKTDVLVIDEISMLDGKSLDLVELICRTIRNRDEAFGGLQVVLVGDFFQLPPIARHGEIKRYAFQSHTWERMRPLICYLGEQHRQEDELLLSLLSAIRSGEIEEDHFTLLNEQTEIEYEGIEPTRLYTHNADVDSVNESHLKSLPGTGRTFKMSGRGAKARVESLTKQCLSPERLVLKEGAMVMCTKNNFEEGYVNGTMARVVGFSGTDNWPVIETTDKRKLTIKPQSWEMMEDGKVMASIEQVPLRLAWAVTVHKSQGMSLDAAEIDLSKAFVFGQGYVALSRVRSLAGLKVLGMHPNALQVDPEVRRRDAGFREESESAEETFQEMAEEELVALQKQFVISKGGKFIDKDTPIESAAPAERIKKESTTEQTLYLLKEGKSIREVAKVRNLAMSTIVGHVEQLLASDSLDVVEVWPLVEELGIEKIDVEKVRQVAAGVETGLEKLKPLYEATEGEYDYETLRLLRLAILLADKA